MTLRRSGPLQRGKPLVARTALTRRTPLLPSSSLQHGGGLKRVPFRPQRAAVTPAERRARKLVKARATDGLCELCGVHPGREWSHRLPRSAGGAWTAENGVWACSGLSTPPGVQGCHQRAHANPELAYRLGWFVHRGQDPATTPVWFAGREFVLIDAQGGVTPITEIPDNEAS